MPNVSEDILRRIKKLLSLASSSNENEAASAAAKAQDLMFQYELDMSVVEGYNIDKDNQIEESAIAAFGGRAANWKMWLFTAVARTSLCEPYISRSRTGQRGMIIGRKSDTELARYTFDYLIKEIERLSDAFMANQIYYDRGHARTLRRSWLEGAVLMVTGNLYSDFRARKEQSEASTALVVSREGEIKDYMNKIGMSLTSRSSSRSEVDSYAYRQGKADGASISIRRGLSGSKGSRQIQ